MALTAHEMTLLKIVLEYANGDRRQIENGIRFALRNTQDRARRTYLWGKLIFHARRMIIRKNDTSHVVKSFSKKTITEARAHERFHSYRTDC